MVDEPRVPLSPAAGAESRPTIYEMIAARARRTSDGALATCAGTGLLALAAFPAVHVRWWGPICPMIALGAFGAWGIADRELATPASTAPSRYVLLALRSAKRAAPVIGTIAAVLAGAWIMTVALGPFIS